MDVPLGRSQGSRNGRCKGITARGTPCRKPPMHGRDVCKQHSDDPDKGRRTLRTPELTAEIVRRLWVGAYVHDVMQSIGLQRQTFYAWTERGEADKEAGRETVFADFADATKGARAEAMITAVAKLSVAWEGMTLIADQSSFRSSSAASVWGGVARATSFVWLRHCCPPHSRPRWMPSL
jgi:hypothetical protein